MSRWECRLPNGRRPACGLDLDTGGCFCSESYGSPAFLYEKGIDLGQDSDGAPNGGR